MVGDRDRCNDEEGVEIADRSCGVLGEWYSCLDGDVCWIQSQKAGDETQ
jgi:hypothetical protein